MKKLISIVTSAYNEENNIDELARQLRMMFDENPEYDFEVILVENGSSDGTFEKMQRIYKNDCRFKIVQLSRNFGMDGGVTAGLTYARGDAAVIMTANLQDKPAVITEMIKRWEDGYENVYGIVKGRPGKGFLRRLNSQLFYALANWLTGRMIPRNVSDFRLVSREMYETINQMQERNRFLRGMFAWTGFRSIGVEYERAPRFAGRSHARFLHVLQLAVQGLLQRTGMALGILPEIEIADGEIYLHPGDRFLLYTDGVTEAFSVQDQLYGVERLESVFSRTSQSESKNMLDEIENSVLDFTQGLPLSDDLTLIGLIRGH